MKQLLYLEIPTPATDSVRDWLQTEFTVERNSISRTPSGIRLRVASTVQEAAIPDKLQELSIFVWSVQRTTYLKVFRWGDKTFPNEAKILKRLKTLIRKRFPNQYPEPPAIDLSSQTIFEALAPYYPSTVKYFQKMPNGEYDLKRAYWWEQRWREGVRNPTVPKQVIFTGHENTTNESPEYDLIYIGGALGVIHAAVMARLGYKVLLIERLPFGRMNRE